jgi:hypothetical protein
VTPTRVGQEFMLPEHVALTGHARSLDSHVSFHGLCISKNKIAVLYSISIVQIE